MPFEASVAFERSLAVGMEVEARWTANHHFYTARAKVVKLNAKSVRVELLEPIIGVRYNFKAGAYEGATLYPLGHPISCPRLLAGTWSENNRVAPFVPAAEPACP